MKIIKQNNKEWQQKEGYSKKILLTKEDYIYVAFKFNYDQSDLYWK